jgi:hypothetical protein
VVELLASLGIEDQHDDNGPGSTYCTACGRRVPMRWKNGQRVDEERDLTHDPHCPLMWAISTLAGRPKE